MSVRIDPVTGEMTGIPGVRAGQPHPSLLGPQGGRGEARIGTVEPRTGMGESRIGAVEPRTGMGEARIGTVDGNRPGAIGTPSKLGGSSSVIGGIGAKAGAAVAGAIASLTELSQKAREFQEESATTARCLDGCGSIMDGMVNCIGGPSTEMGGLLARVRARIEELRNECNQDMNNLNAFIEERIAEARAGNEATASQLQSVAGSLGGISFR